jgi:transposase
MKPKQYSEEFRREALHLLQTSGKTKTELERDLDLSHGLLRKWELRYQVNPTTDTLARSDTEQLKAEVRRLQREVELLRQEREILKKTVAIFSHDPLRNATP